MCGEQKDKTVLEIQSTADHRPPAALTLNLEVRYVQGISTILVRKNAGSNNVGYRQRFAEGRCYQQLQISNNVETRENCASTMSLWSES